MHEMGSNGLYFFLVCLQDLRDKSLSLLDFINHFTVVINLDCNDFELVIDELGKPFTGSVVDWKITLDFGGRFSRRSRLGRQTF